MDIRDLGFEDWFSSRVEGVLQAGQSLARVMTVDRGAFLVRGEQGEGGEGSEVSAELSGKYRFGVESACDMPCVGDWVCVEYASDELAIIHAVLPRKTVLRRKSSGKTVDFQMIATNLDVAFIVQSCNYDFNIRRLERYLVAVEEGNIDPLVILSKTDTVTEEELAVLVDKIRGVGISARLVPISNVTGCGLDEFRSLLEAGKTYCLIGSSGVGKTTLINRLLGRDVLETKAVSMTGEGVHTTARRQLLVLDNGAMMIDTPGMRELGLLGAGDAVEESFSDICELALSCRFPNCSHTQEPGCAVLGAVAAGEVSEERHQIYIKLQKESDYHDLSYAEKRKKDRNFGRFIKSAKKHKRH